MVKKLISFLKQLFSNEHEENTGKKFLEEKGHADLSDQQQGHDSQHESRDQQELVERECPKNIHKEEEQSVTYEDLDDDYKITENFTYGELIASETAEEMGIENVPDEEQTKRLFTLTEKVLQPIRDHFDVPVIVTGGFRNRLLNQEIGGANNSQHIKGEAADISIDDHTVNEAFEEIVKGNFEFDQIIWEFGNWVHVSYTTRRKNRNEILTAKENEAGQIYYTKWTREQVKNKKYR